MPVVGGKHYPYTKKGKKAAAAAKKRVPRKKKEPISWEEQQAKTKAVKLKMAKKSDPFGKRGR